MMRHARAADDLHCRGIPFGRLRQGRHRTWPADRIDGPARGRHDRRRERLARRHRARNLLAGMFIGQAVRARMQADTFRRWFLIAMILLGIYFSASAICNLAR
jgi:hypothetical protein